LFGDLGLLQSPFRKNKGPKRRIRFSIGLTNILTREYSFKTRGYTGRKSAELGGTIPGPNILDITGQIITIGYNDENKLVKILLNITDFIYNYFQRFINKYYK